MDTKVQSAVLAGMKNFMENKSDEESGVQQTFSPDEVLYRVLPLKYFFDIVKNKRLYFVDVALWEDTHECLGDNSKIKVDSDEVADAPKYKGSIYGSCWTKDEENDAMWRIYSPNKDGIRIGVKGERIVEILKNQYNKMHPAVAHENYDAMYPVVCTKDVRYHTEKEIDGIRHSLHLEDIFKNNNYAIELLSLKRTYFAHEKETRCLVYCDNKDLTELDGKLLPLDFDASKDIDSITLDPRLPDSEFETLKWLLCEKLGFSSNAVQKSRMYAKPNSIVYPVN